MFPGDVRDFGYDLLGGISGGAVQVSDIVSASGEELLTWMADVSTFRVEAQRKRLRALITRGEELKEHAELTGKGKTALTKYKKNLAMLDGVMLDSSKERLRRAAAKQFPGPILAFGNFKSVNPIVLRPLHPKQPGVTSIKATTLNSLTVEVCRHHVAATLCKPGLTCGISGLIPPSGLGCPP